ncbi:hydrolase 76 protein [Podochytrium sp. JEL0797]|nr:hydrolase 76 protein [Podochytrium sp. JEL0797]
MAKTILTALSLLLPLSSAFAQQNIDLTSKDAVMAAANAAMIPLQANFASNTEKNGAWIEQYPNGQWCIQWHESGIYQDLFYQHVAYSGDTTWQSFADTNIALSANGNGDFMGGLDPNVPESTRWNDDISWWAISAMTRAEIGGTTDSLYFQLANRTFQEVWMSWDASSCGGGIFWSRDRNAGNNPTLKSSITNVEMMDLGARLYRMTKDSYFKDRVDQIYAWLQSSGLLSANYVVYDSVKTTDCTPNLQIYSYHTGELLMGLSVMFQATNDPHYLNEAHNVFASIKSQFTDSNNVLNQEPSCLAGACTKSPTGYWWSVYKGLAQLHVATNNVSVQQSIEKIMRASAAVNFQNCGSDWNCMRILPVGTAFTLIDGTNQRDQFETVVILNSLAVINGAAGGLNGSAVVTASGTQTAVVTATHGRPKDGTASANGVTSPTQASLSYILSAVLSAAKSAMGPLQQYFNGPNVEGKGSWTEQDSSGRWVVQWHESGQYNDMIYQYALASGDSSNNGFVHSNLIASAAGNGDFLGGFTADQVQDTRWNDDIAWWGLASQTGAEATGDATLASLASKTFDEVWMSWDNQCGGGIFWSRDRDPSASNPYLKSAITNVQMMDLGARLGKTDQVNQIWSWLKSSGLVVDDGNGGYVIYDNIMTNNCSKSSQVYSYHYGEAMTALSVMGNVGEATKLFTGLKNIFVDASNVLGPIGICKKDPCGYSWPVYKGLAHLFQATTDAGTKSSITSVMKATAAVVLANCDSNWACMRNFGAGTAWTLLQPDGLNVRDQFEAVAFLNAMISISNVSAPVATSAVPTTPASSLNSATGNVLSGIWLMVAVVCAVAYVV